MPDRNDSSSLLAGIPESIQQKYLPKGTRDLAKLWTELLALTVSLAKILLWQNRAERTLSSRSEIQRMDDNIRQYYFRKDHAIAHRQMRRTKDAANNTNKILSNMISTDMIRSTQAIVCIALVPTLQIHLLNTTSEKQLVQRIGRHNLKFCMIVIEELKSVYFGAEILSRIFTKAESQIYNQTLTTATVPRGHTPDTTLGSTIGSPPEVPADAHQDNIEVFDIFSTILSPFAPITAGGLFDNNGLFAFEPDITLGQLMFPKSESSADA
ncbi:Transcription factor [Penicillium freii]|nr:Transcription factor [Penicillium freii]